MSLFKTNLTATNLNVTNLTVTALPNTNGIFATNSQARLTQQSPAQSHLEWQLSGHHRHTSADHPR